MALAVAAVLCEGNVGDMTREEVQPITEDPKQLSELIERLTTQPAEVWERALRDGLAQGFKAKGMQTALLRVLARRGVTLSPEQEADIRKTYGIDELEYWIDRAVTANSAEELFADPMD